MKRILAVLLLLLASIPAVAQVTPINRIQGPGAESPMVGQTVTVEAVLTADFRSTLDGIFLQEEQKDWDEDPRTSEGIFVYLRGVQTNGLRPGTLIRVTGQVNEFRGQTQLSRVEKIEAVGQATTVPARIELPLASPEHWEHFEGMLVTIPGPIVVADTYDLGRYGQVLLAHGARQSSPTNVVAPGDEARALAIENARRRFILDDGNTAQNPNPTPFLGPDGTLRVGDGIDSLTGILTYAFDEYRVYPVGPIRFERRNPRPTIPPAVGGSLRVASFNVLNYFNGDGKGGDFPTPRGAKTPAEFARQHAKIVSALVAMHADIVGLIEMENDGYGPESALQELVRGLNAKAPEGTRYTAVVTDADVGSDAIRQAIIYNTATVREVGTAATTSAGPFGIRRPPLAQTFEEVATGGRLTVVINHLKSKGCGQPDPANADANDGQGCWNAERTEAARILVEWLKTNPTGVEEEKVLILGDLNAYAKEDPVRTILDAGFANALMHFSGPTAHTYVYRGEAGALDHALPSLALAPHVTGAAPWHINADEPRILDYGMEFNPPNLYTDGPWRSSDHDPVLVGIGFPTK
jgi:predicted extracellular nuclease